ncbi:uncharacterized protein [Antedon mediterranea]|uniref:uncharacterized protein n=1 Tax=Antedon mediterranea TaxID=105859 RepID=UPI003AF44E5C
MFLRNHDDTFAGKKSYLSGQSTANQRIESWWGQLRKQCTEFWILIFKYLIHEGHFSGDLLDKELVRFVFMRLIQDDLDRTAELWDTHLIRRSKQDHVTNGCPLVMFQLPQVYHSRDHIKQVDQRRIDLCKESSKFKDQYPCDRDLFEYCLNAIIFNEWEIPTTPEGSMLFYINLRDCVRREIGFFSILATRNILN